MRRRVSPGFGHVGIGLEVPLTIEEFRCSYQLKLSGRHRQNIAALVYPALKVVQEGICSGRGYVGIALDIALSGKVRARIASLRRAARQIVRSGINARRSYVWIGSNVPLGIE